MWPCISLIGGAIRTARAWRTASGFCAAPRRWFRVPSRSRPKNRDIKDVLEGGEISIPLEGMREPRFHREGGTRDLVLPGNKKFLEGDILPRPDEGGGKPSEPGEGDGEDAFRFVLSRDEFVDLFLDDLELPDLAKRKLAETESEGLRRAG